MRVVQKFKIISGFIFLFVIFTTTVSFAGGCNFPTVVFSGKNYSLKYMYETNEVKVNEYQDSNSSNNDLNNWQTMLTIKEYLPEKKLSDIIPVYLKQLQNVMIMQPKIYMRNNNINDITIILYLADSANNKIEYVINHIFKLDNKPPMAYIFSQRLLLKSSQNITSVIKAQTKRIKNLWSLNKNIINYEQAKLIKKCLNN